MNIKSIWGVYWIRWTDVHLDYKVNYESEVKPVIKKICEQYHMEFGTGDIHIRSGWHIPEGEDKRLGLVVFENHEKPMPIGMRGTTPAEVELWKYPVYMTFSRVESIDALIAELLNAREEMCKQEKD